MHSRSTVIVISPLLPDAPIVAGEGPRASAQRTEVGAVTLVVDDDVQAAMTTRLTIIDARPTRAPIARLQYGHYQARACRATCTCGPASVFMSIPLTSDSTPSEPNRPVHAEVAAQWLSSSGVIASRLAGNHARHVPGSHHQGARGLGNPGSDARSGRGVRRSPSDDLHHASRPVPGEARCRRARQRALPGGGRPRCCGDLHGTPLDLGSGREPRIRMVQNTCA